MDQDVQFFIAIVISDTVKTPVRWTGAGFQPASKQRRKFSRHSLTDHEPDSEATDLRDGLVQRGTPYQESARQRNAGNVSTQRLRADA